MSSEKPSAKLHIDDEMKGTADFPLYGERIADILPPEHFLWQLQGSFPGFDDELAGMYRSQRSLKHISKASWPEDILIPGDFYMQGIVIPQLRGLLPPLSSDPEDHPETGTVEVQEDSGRGSSGRFRSGNRFLGRRRRGRVAGPRERRKFRTGGVEHSVAARGRQLGSL